MQRISEKNIGQQSGLDGKGGWKSIGMISGLNGEIEMMCISED